MTWSPTGTPCNGAPVTAVFRSGKYRFCSAPHPRPPVSAKLWSRTHTGTRPYRSLQRPHIVTSRISRNRQGSFLSASVCAEYNGRKNKTNTSFLLTVAPPYSPATVQCVKTLLMNVDQVLTISSPGWRCLQRHPHYVFFSLGVPWPFPRTDRQKLGKKNSNGKQREAFSQFVFQT